MRRYTDIYKLEIFKSKIFFKIFSCWAHFVTIYRSKKTETYKN